MPSENSLDNQLVRTHDNVERLVREWFERLEARTATTVKLQFKRTPDPDHPGEVTCRGRVHVKVGNNSTLFDYGLPEPTHRLENLCKRCLEPYEAWKAEDTRWRGAI